MRVAVRQRGGPILCVSVRLVSCAPSFALERTRAHQRRVAADPLHHSFRTRPRSRWCTAAFTTHVLGSIATLWWMMDGLHVHWLSVIVLLSCLPPAVVELGAVGVQVAKEVSLCILRGNNNWAKADKERFHNKGL